VPPTIGTTIAAPIAMIESTTRISIIVMPLARIGARRAIGTGSHAERLRGVSPRS
jgi:hypothetical protein